MGVDYGSRQGFGIWLSKEGYDNICKLVSIDYDILDDTTYDNDKFDGETIAEDFTKKVEDYIEKNWGAKLSLSFDESGNHYSSREWDSGWNFWLNVEVPTLFSDDIDFDKVSETLKEIAKVKDKFKEVFDDTPTLWNDVVIY